MAIGKLFRETLGHLERIAEELGQSGEPVHGWIAGGVAVNYYVDYRMSRDVDIKWSHRFRIPPDLMKFRVEIFDSETGYMDIGMDLGFGDYLGLFSPDWQENCIEVARFGNIVVHVMEPHDLAVSKAGPFRPRDQDDIRRLAMAGLLDPDIFLLRAEEALEYYTTSPTFVKYNIRDTAQIIRDTINDSGNIPEP